MSEYKRHWNDYGNRPNIPGVVATIIYPKGDIDVDIAAFIIENRHEELGVTVTSKSSGRHIMTKKSSMVFYGNPSFANSLYQEEEKDGMVYRSVIVNNPALIVASIYRPEDRGHLFGHVPIRMELKGGGIKGGNLTIHLNEEFPDAMSVQIAEVGYGSFNLIGLGSQTDLRKYFGLMNIDGSIVH